MPCLHSYALRKNLSRSLYRHNKIRILTKDKVTVVSSFFYFTPSLVSPYPLSSLCPSVSYCSSYSLPLFSYHYPSFSTRCLIIPLSLFTHPLPLLSSVSHSSVLIPFLLCHSVSFLFLSLFAPSFLLSLETPIFGERS